MAAVRQRRQLNLRLPELAADRRPRFPVPLLPSAPTTTSSSFLSSDLDKLSVLGHGNGGTVYKVRHRRTSQIHALKLVRADSDPAARRLLLREVEILCRASDSPHIVRCHGVAETPSDDMTILLFWEEGRREKEDPWDFWVGGRKEIEGDEDSVVEMEEEGVW
ncbi:unnamed protein product [Linum tenue]|uniref:mitogen-activated protein kinase kinase n=1 Tax=Linum tenue TaxID=586396 RepID=A0AAV0HSU4_9ROSI|nr:unnamed protein product [Linum tenue]